MSSSKTPPLRAMDFLSAISRLLSYLLLILNTHFCLASSPLKTLMTLPTVMAVNNNILFLYRFIKQGLNDFQ